MRSAASAVVLALLLAQVAFLVLRTLASLGLVTGLWAFNLPAYLAPALRALAAWAPLLAWLVVAMLSRRAAGAPEAPPSALARSLAVLVLVGPPLLCLALPDRSGFMGDFIERRGAIAGGRYAAAFPQGLFLDRWIQSGLLPWLAAFLDLDRAARLLGAASYLALLAIAARAARATGLRGLSATTGVVLIAVAGTACLFTGYSRDTVEFMPLELALCVTLAARAGGSDRQPLSPAPELLLLALAALHRSAVVLIAPYLAATIPALRSGSGRAPLAWKLAAGALVAGGVAMIPRYLQVYSTFDLVHHAPWLAAHGSGIPFLDPGHDLDVLEAIAMLAPAAWLAVLALVPASGGPTGLDLALVLCWLPLALLFRPQQGIFRDFDVYAPMALALAFVGVRGLARLAAARPRATRALGAVTAVSSVQGMLALVLVAADPVSANLRVQAALDAKRLPPALNQAQMLDYLADGASLSQDYRRAAGLYSRSAALAPTIRRLVDAGTAFADAGDYARSRTYFARLIASDSLSVLGWCGYAATSLQLGDSVASTRSLPVLRALTAPPRKLRVAAELLDQFWRLDPRGRLRDSLAAAARAPASAP